MNHFSKVCLSKEVHQLQEVAETDTEPEGDSDNEESDDSLFVYSVKSSCVAEDEQFYEAIEVEDTEVRFQLDSGAKANVMSLSNLQQSQAKTTSPAENYEHCVDFLL